MLMSSSLVKFEGKDHRLSTVYEILDQKIIEIEDEASSFAFRLPFCNANYRAKVRVVDFYPDNITQFVRPKKAPSDMDILSDAESCSSYENDTQESRHDGEWAWHFMLKLEDASEKGEQATFWVVLDNPMTERLTDLTATNLANPRQAEFLEAFREKMFILWGNLEELKNSQKSKRSRGKRVSGQGPPPDSDDDEQVVITTEVPRDKIQNTPFECCIRQYGIKVPEQDPKRADAGDGKRWQRMYGMFGTRIRD